MNFFAILLLSFAAVTVEAREVSTFICRYDRVSNLWVPLWSHVLSGPINLDDKQVVDLGGAILTHRQATSGTCGFVSTIGEKNLIGIRFASGYSLQKVPGKCEFSGLSVNISEDAASFTGVDKLFAAASDSTDFPELAIVGVRQYRPDSGNVDCGAVLEEWFSHDIVLRAVYEDAKQRSELILRADGKIIHSESTKRPLKTRFIQHENQDLNDTYFLRGSLALMVSKEIESRPCPAQDSKVRGELVGYGKARYLLRSHSEENGTCIENFPRSGLSGIHENFVNHYIQRKIPAR